MSRTRGEPTRAPPCPNDRGETRRWTGGDAPKKDGKRRGCFHERFLAGFEEWANLRWVAWRGTQESIRALDRPRPGTDSELSSTNPGSSNVFIRFVTNQRDADSLKRQGVFTPVYVLLGSGELGLEERRRLRGVVEWFEDNLPLPDRSRISPKGIFWFRSDADEPIRRLWDVVGVLDSHNVAIEMLSTHKPGRIVYDDQFQVCAVPFRDTALRGGRAL